MRERRFRDDLFYRLNVVTMKLPPLRERPEDIVQLAKHFLHRYARELGKPIEGIAQDACDLLELYSWPGNIRELENTIERGVLMSEGNTLRPSDLGLSTLVGPGTPLSHQRDLTSNTSRVPAQTGSEPRESNCLEDIEKSTILQVLAQTNWIQKDAARLLGISPRVLNYKIKTHGITHQSWLKHRPAGENLP